KGSFTRKLPKTSASATKPSTLTSGAFTRSFRSAHGQRRWRSFSGDSPVVLVHQVVLVLVPPSRLDSAAVRGREGGTSKRTMTLSPELGTGETILEKYSAILFAGLVQ